MTAVDSQTILLLDTKDFAFSAKKDGDEVQVVAFNGTSDVVEAPSSDSCPLIYWRKGEGRRPHGGGLRASNTSSSSAKNNPPPKFALPRPVAANPPPKTSHSSSNDKTKKKKA